MAYQIYESYTSTRGIDCCESCGATDDLYQDEDGFNLCRNGIQCRLRGPAVWNIVPTIWSWANGKNVDGKDTPDYYSVAGTVLRAFSKNRRNSR